MQTEMQLDTMCAKLSTSTCASLLTPPKHKIFSKKSDLIVMYSRKITLDKLGWEKYQYLCQTPGHIASALWACVCLHASTSTPGWQSTVFSRYRGANGVLTPY